MIKRECVRKKNFFVETCISIKLSTNRSSQLQCIIVLTLQLNKPYFFWKPPIQNGQAKSWILQHLSVLEKLPRLVYFFAVYPTPHHCVSGILSRSYKSLFRLSNIYSITLFYFIKKEREKLHMCVGFHFNFKNISAL